MQIIVYVLSAYTNTPRGALFPSRGVLVYLKLLRLIYQLS